MNLLFPDALLVLSLLFVRPVAVLAWRSRLPAHALLLAVCLLDAVLSGSRPGLAAVGMLAAVIQAGLAWRLLRGQPDAPAFQPPRTVVWLLVGLVLVGLSVRLLPDAALPAFPRGILSASTAILLAGLLGALANKGSVARFGSLLIAGNGMIMAACALPGMGLSSLVGLLLLQAGLFWSLAQAWTGVASAPGADGGSAS